MRWTLALQDYDFEISHRAGASHQNADGLSRQAWPDDDTPEPRFCLKKGEMSGSPDIHRPNYTRTVVLCLILVHQFLTLLTEVAPLSCIALLKPMGHLCDCVSLCVCKDFIPVWAT